MFRDSFSISILGFLILTSVVLIEAPQIVAWASLTFSQQWMYGPILLLWVLLFIFIGIELTNRKKRKK